MNERIEICWGCHKPLSRVVIQARPSYAKLTGGGWHSWHPACVPEGYEIRPDA